MPPSERPPRVVAFGDLIDDIVVVPRGPIRPDTDTASSIARRPGGSAANTAAWLATRGAAVTFVGRCGAADAARHAAELRAAGVEPVLTGDDALPTGTIVVIVEGERRSMLTERGANALLSPVDVADDLLRGAALLHGTGYGLIDHTGEFAGLVARAHALGVRVSLNVGSVQAIDTVGVDSFTAAIAGVDVLFASRDEAELLTGRRSAVRASAALVARHGVAVVTTGPLGAIVGRAGAPRTFVPAVPAETVDPTGAGDAFAAGFLADLLGGAGLAEAGRTGAQLAARAVEVVGGRPRHPPI